MNTRHSLVLGFAILPSLFLQNIQAQVITFTPAILYQLQSGSQLLRDCPVCDYIPHPVPMSGTFWLAPGESNPFSTHYALRDIQFTAGETTTQYVISGNGVYVMTGEFALTQTCSLSVDVLSATDDIHCEAANSDILVSALWPNIQTLLVQSNGTLAINYELTLVASPVMQLTRLAIDTSSGDVTVEWFASGKVQLERAQTVEGPYTSVSPVTTDAIYTDSGAYLKEKSLFYRLRKL